MNNKCWMIDCLDSSHSHLMNMVVAAAVGYNCCNETSFDIDSCLIYDYLMMMMQSPCLTRRYELFAIYLNDDADDDVYSSVGDVTAVVWPCYCPMLFPIRHLTQLYYHLTTELLVLLCLWFAYLLVD